MAFRTSVPRSDLTEDTATFAPFFRSAFEVLDADHDGKISRDNLNAFYSGLPSRPSEEDIVSMIFAADADRDGFVTFVQFDEFERVLGGGLGKTGNLMEEMFRAMIVVLSL